MTTDNENESKYADYMHPTPYSWKRPEGPPRVWRVVEGRKKTTNGEIPRFSIQEVPKELEDEVVEFMLKYFIVEEPICCDLGIADNPLAVRELRTYWRNIVRQGISVIALRVNSDPAVKPVLAGVNVLVNVGAEDAAAIAKTMNQFRTKHNKKLMGMVATMSKEADSMGKYGVNRSLVGIGLSVHPTLRGQGIGQQLLRAREDIGIAYQIPMSDTCFTAIESQTIAARDGFEVLLEWNYSEILDEEGKVAFSGLAAKSEVKSVKMMGKRLY